MKKKVLMFLMVSCSSLFAFLPSTQSVSTIEQFGADIIATPTVDNDYTLLVTTSNTVIDLGGYTISQDSSNNQTGLRAILVSPHLNNVTIKNGVIQDVNGIGIEVRENCTNIKIVDMQFIGCTDRAVVYDGSSGAINGLHIQECQILDCCEGSSGDCAILLNTCSKALVKNTAIVSSGNSGNSFAGLQLSNCFDSSIQDISVLNCAGSSVVCFEIENSRQCNFRNCLGRSNSASSGSFRGFDLHGADSSNNVFEGCIINESSSTVDAIGYFLEENAQANTFRNCLATGLSGASVDGFVLDGEIDNNLNNSFYDCVASSNRASGSKSNATGWRIGGSAYGILLNCVASFQTSENGEAIGLELESKKAESWLIQHCKFVRNLGQKSSDSFGIRVNKGAGKSNMFFQNVAFSNGTGSGRNNQLSGLSQGVFAEQSTSNMPYSGLYANIAIAD